MNSRKNLDKSCDKIYNEPVTKRNIFVTKIISDIGATSIKDMGAVMKKAKEEIGTAADGRTINEVVKELLA